MRLRWRPPAPLLPRVRQKASNRHAWLEWIAKGNFPVAFVEMESTRRYSNLATVRDMEIVTKAVERSINDELLERFGAILDRWTHCSNHYLAVQACYDKDGVRHCLLLYMVPIINGPDDRLNAENYMCALASFLPFFGKDVSNVIFLVGDNCAVNRRLARLMGVPLVGCVSHRLNFAVRRFLEPYEKELEQVQSLMRLRTITQAAKLRLKTRLRPKLRQDTPWGSPYTMMARYFELRKYISADDEDLAEVMPSLTANRKIKTVLVQLFDAQTVAMKLQCEDLTLLDARDLLNDMLEVMSSFETAGGTPVLLS
ncbi:hypothetical protein F443_05899 [Phytophthora nicotianae P1569]|uniref:Uncharacterized protein n=1 Tax=Phytophthora nicotianae P1569 TaxID=1317065 RepID=V9FIF9_PHYNI|nr:hypothetical protein F443_05899 [Phytophthora nicotianae P1569]